jgi:hypothetical protein
MLRNFLSLLRVRLQRIAQTVDQRTETVTDTALAQKAEAERQADLVELSEDLAKLEQTDWRGRELDAWNEAYRVERELVLAEPTQHLWIELKRRLAQAFDENVPAAKRLDSMASALSPQVLDSKTPGAIKTECDTAVRSLLLETLEEIHSTKQRKYVSRPIRKEATTKIVSCCLSAFVAFMLPYAVLYMSPKPQVDISSWTWLPIYSAATAGLFGALFSRLLYLQSKWDALTIGGLKEANDLTSIGLRASVGTIGAVIVFFFLKAGIVSGTLFPDFSQIGVEGFKFPAPLPGETADYALRDAPVSFRLYYPSKSWALLVVWCFVAGFSERLVPSILRETESTFDNSLTQK